MTAADRESTLRWACQLEEVRLSPRVDLSDLSRKTASFVLGDIAALVRTAQAYSHQRVRCHWADKVVMEAVKTTESDFEGALAKFHELLADSIGAPKVPEVKWEDVGECTAAKFSPKMLQQQSNVVPNSSGASGLVRAKEGYFALGLGCQWKYKTNATADI